MLESPIKNRRLQVLLLGNDLFDLFGEILPKRGHLRACDSKQL